MNVSNDESIQDYPLVIVKWKDAVINEEYNGSTWSEEEDLNTARLDTAGAG